MPELQLHAVCIVTVTYGRRWELLSQVIEAALQQHVAHVVVVDNGSAQSISELVAANFDHRVDVIRLDENKGSAFGFRHGIEHALLKGTEFIWLLDDDNQPEPKALERLLHAWRYLGSNPDYAMSCFRPQWPAQSKMLCDGKDTYVLDNAFLGFRSVDMPEKFMRRVLGGGELNGIPRFDLARIPIAPYGGLLMHRGLLSKIDLPDTRLFLYADDTFFTAQIPARGGAIYLCAAAGITDLMPSWQTGHDGWRGHPFFNPDTNIVRIYFSVRNALLWEKQRSRSLSYWLNGLVMISFGSLLSLLVGASPRLCVARLGLVWRAMRAAEREDFTTPKDVQAAWERMQQK